MRSHTIPDLERARSIASQVVDPEIPVLSVADLGIIRDVSVEHGRVVVTITPTYSGCPALRQIADDIKSELTEHGFENVVVRTVHSPAWTTEWMSAEGRRKLAEFGRSLDAGVHVMSGSFTRQFPLAPGDHLEARFAPFGTVRARVE